MIFLKQILAAFIGFGSGIVVSGAVFAFITIIGVIPRLAQKTGTERYAMLYETAITVGGVWGASTMFINYYIPAWNIVVILLALCVGVFIGCFAISLAEVLDVIPILTRRARLQKGMRYFILSLAIGKLVGSILYYAYPNFYT